MSYELPPEQTSAAAWYGPDIAKRDDWLMPLGSADVAEIEAATRALVARDADIAVLAPQDFPLPTLGARLRSRVDDEVLNGRGFLLLRGLPVERWSMREAATAFFGLGAHLGSARSQNGKGHVLGHVQDLGLDVKDPNVRIYQTHERQTYHTDSCDIVGLCCLETAKSGGLSTVASSVAVYNALVRSRPDLVKILSQPFYADRRGEESADQKPYYVTPIFIWHKGRMFNRFNRTFIDSAQRFDEVPRLTQLQIEALDAVATLCRDPAFRLDIKLERGDMQFVNNYCVLHSRTAYEDHAEESKKRHLLRLWLRTSAFVDYPAALRDRYEDMDKWRSNPRPPSYHFVAMAEVTTH